jgi:eukaryotic-like serine/threonine-protein kinase
VQTDLVTVLPTGTVIAGRYRIESLLGMGGFGAVYEAVNLPTGRVVALKTLLPEAAQIDEMIVARFRREALATHLLDHPHIVATLDLGFEAGQVFMAMELVRGESLRQALASGPLPVRRSLVLTRQILEGVGHAHAQGLVHRDLKPENVMLTLAGQPGVEYELVKLLDFGLVKLLGDELGSERLTRTGMIFGTPAYMAPEQALGRAVDARADLYALGAMLFEMLTGRRPFEAADPLTLMRLHVSQPVPELCERVGVRPWQTRELEALVRGALEKRVEARFKSASEMMASLDAAFASLNHLPAGI